MVTAIILVGSINALSYNVVHYLMIQMTSAVTTTVLGEVKIIGLLVLSVMLLGELIMGTHALCTCYTALDLQGTPMPGLRLCINLALAVKCT